MNKKYICIRVRSNWNQFDKKIILQDPISVKDDNNINGEAKKIFVDLDENILNGDNLLRKSKIYSSFFVLLRGKSMNWEDDGETLRLNNAEILPLFLTKEEANSINNSAAEEKPKLVQEIQAKCDNLNEKKNSFLRLIKQINWWIPVSSTGEADDGRTNLTHHTLWNWLTDQNKISSPNPNWEVYISDEHVNTETELEKRILLIKKYLLANFSAFDGKKNHLLNYEQKQSIINDNKIDEQLKNDPLFVNTWKFISQLGDTKTKLEQTVATNKKAIDKIKKDFKKSNKKKNLCLGEFYKIATTDSVDDNPNMAEYRKVCNFLNEKSENLLTNIFNQPELYTKPEESEGSEDSGNEELETKELVQLPQFTASYEDYQEKYWKFNPNASIRWKGNAYSALYVPKKYISEAEIKASKSKFGNRFFEIKLPLIDEFLLEIKAEEGWNLEVSDANDELEFIPLRLLKDTHDNLLVEIEPIKYKLNNETSTINYLKINNQIVKTLGLESIISMNNERLASGDRRPPGIFSVLNWGKKLTIKDLIWDIGTIETKKDRQGWTIAVSLTANELNVPAAIKAGDFLKIDKPETIQNQNIEVANEPTPTKYHQAMQGLSDLITKATELLRTNSENLTEISKVIEKLNSYQNTPGEKAWAFTYYEFVNDFGNTEGYAAGSPKNSLTALLNRQKTLNPEWNEEDAEEKNSETSEVPSELSTDDEEEPLTLAKIQKSIDEAENIEETYEAHCQLIDWLDENNSPDSAEEEEIAKILTNITKKALAKLNNFEDKEVRGDWRNDNDYIRVFGIINAIFFRGEEKFKDLHEKTSLTPEEKKTIRLVAWKVREAEKQIVLRDYYRFYQGGTPNHAKAKEYFEDFFQTNNHSWLKINLFAKKILKETFGTIYTIIDQENNKEFFKQFEAENNSFSRWTYQEWSNNKDFYAEKFAIINSFVQAWEVVANFYRNDILKVPTNASKGQIKQAFGKLNWTLSQQEAEKEITRQEWSEKFEIGKCAYEFLLKEATRDNDEKTGSHNISTRKLDFLKKLIECDNITTSFQEDIDSIFEELATQAIKDKCAWLGNTDYNQNQAVNKIVNEPNQNEKLKLFQNALADIGTIESQNSGSEDSIPLKFYHKDQPYYELSNFYYNEGSKNIAGIIGEAKYPISCRIPRRLNEKGEAAEGERNWLTNYSYLSAEGKWEFPTAEHLFQALKFANDTDAFDLINGILNSSNPSEARQFANEPTRRNCIKADWHTGNVPYKLRAMRWVIREKFSQNPDLKKLLLETDYRLIIEDTFSENRWNDDYWGNGNGTNYSDGRPAKLAAEQGENWLGRVLMETRTLLKIEKALDKESNTKLNSKYGGDWRKHVIDEIGKITKTYWNKGDAEIIETEIIALEKNIVKELVSSAHGNLDDEQQKEIFKQIFEGKFKGKGKDESKDNSPKFVSVETKLDNKTIKYQFAKDGDKLTYAEFIDLLKTKNEDFLRVFRDELHQIGLETGGSYFWECVPVTKNDTNREFEFVVVKSAALDNIRQDLSSFQEHINKYKDKPKLACSFPNLRGDATLIIPLPQKTGSSELVDYKNLKEFSDNAPEEQWNALWQKVGEKMDEELEKSNDPKWLSTHGTGVPYLHVRIDKRAKYYSHKEYRIWDKIEEEEWEEWISEEEEILGDEEKHAKEILAKISTFLAKEKKELNKKAAEEKTDANGRSINVGSAKVKEELRDKLNQICRDGDWNLAELTNVKPKMTAEWKEKLRNLSPDKGVQDKLKSEELFRNKFTALRATGVGASCHFNSLSLWLKGDENWRNRLRLTAFQEAISEESEYFNLGDGKGIDVLLQTTSLGEQVGGEEHTFFATLLNCNIANITDVYGKLTLNIIEPNGNVLGEDNEKETIWLFHSGVYNSNEKHGHYSPLIPNKDEFTQRIDVFRWRLKLELEQLEEGSSNADESIKLKDKTNYHKMIDRADSAGLKNIWTEAKGETNARRHIRRLKKYLTDKGINQNIEEIEKKVLKIWNDNKGDSSKVNDDAGDLVNQKILAIAVNQAKKYIGGNLNSARIDQVQKAIDFLKPFVEKAGQTVTEWEWKNKVWLKNPAAGELWKKLQERKTNIEQENRTPTPPLTPSDFSNSGRSSSNSSNTGFSSQKKAETVNDNSANSYNNSPSTSNSNSPSSTNSTSRTNSSNSDSPSSSNSSSGYSFGGFAGGGGGGGGSFSPPSTSASESGGSGSPTTPPQSQPTKTKPQPKPAPQKTPLTPEIIAEVKTKNSEGEEWTPAEKEVIEKILTENVVVDNDKGNLQPEKIQSPTKITTAEQIKLVQEVITKVAQAQKSQTYSPELHHWLIEKKENDTLVYQTVNAHQQQFEKAIQHLEQLRTQQQAEQIRSRGKEDKQWLPWAIGGGVLATATLLGTAAWYLNKIPTGTKTPQKSARKGKTPKGKS